MEILCSSLHPANKFWFCSGSVNKMNLDNIGIKCHTKKEKCRGDNGKLSLVIKMSQAIERKVSVYKRINENWSFGVYSKWCQADR